MEKLFRTIIGPIKHIFCESGRLIYYLNLPKFIKRVKGIESKPCKEKINIAFVMQCPTCWSSLEPVYKAALRDEKINPIVLLVPEVEFQYYTIMTNVLYEQTYAFGEQNIKGAIQTYNPKTGEWLDLRTLDLDYVFLPRPYETYLPKAYRASTISEYAKVCYISYAFSITDEDYILYNSHFVRNVYMFFNGKEGSYNYLCRHFKLSMNKRYQKAIFTGYPRFDLLKDYDGSEGKLWKQERSSEVCRLIWTPRWTSDPKIGDSNFLKYKDKFVEYANGNPKVEFLFRPHPLTFSHFVGEGLITQSELDDYTSLYEKSNNMILDQTGTYFDTFYSSDILISDLSSVTLDYMFTGNPIIFCPSSPTKGGQCSKEVYECFYVANNFEEVKARIESLRKGEDPLKEVREKFVYKIRRNGKISESVLQEIKKDYFG